METKKVTCWLNWQEWKYMADDAYNEEQDLKRTNRAFSTLIAWEAIGSLPPALVCLKELLSAKLAGSFLSLARNRKDSDDENEEYEDDEEKSRSVHAYYQYQSSLAMNIVRFVNFITEPYQTSTFAKPIKSIAKTLGLPDWIVNLRHNATHFSLPSIEILESARDYLFGWIKVRYIDVYKEIVLEQQTVSHNVKQYIENLLVDYINTRYAKCILSSGSKKKKSFNFTNNIPIVSDQEMSDLENKVEVVVSHFRVETFDALLKSGFMVPSKDQLSALGIMPEEFVEKHFQLNIPKQLLQLWTPLLTYCNNINTGNGNGITNNNSNNNLLHSFFQRMISTYRNETANINNQDCQQEVPEGSFCSSFGAVCNNVTLRNKLLLSWILTLVKLNSNNNKDDDDESQNRSHQFQNHVVFDFEVNFQEVLLAIVGKRRPNRFELTFLKEAVKIPSFMNEIGKEKFAKLFQLFSLMGNLTIGNSNGEMTTLNEENDEDQVVSGTVPPHSHSSSSKENKNDNERIAKYSSLFRLNQIPHVKKHLVQNNNNTMMFDQQKQQKKTNNNKNIKSDWKLVEANDWDDETAPKLGLVEAASRGAGGEDEDQTNTCWQKLDAALKVTTFQEEEEEEEEEEKENENEEGQRPQKKKARKQENSNNAEEDDTISSSSKKDPKSMMNGNSLFSSRTDQLSKNFVKSFKSSLFNNYWELTKPTASY